MDAQTLQCPFCSTISTRGTGLTAHIRGRHPKQYSEWIKDSNRLQAAGKGARSFKCPDCGKSFKTQGALGGHRAYLHKGPKDGGKPTKPEVDQVVCPECGKTFKNRGALGGHIAYLHKNLKKGHELAKPHSVEAVHALPSPPSEPPAAAASAPHPAEAQSLTQSSAREHLRAAREALVGREQHIEAELNRLRELEAEKERVRRELDAVNTALQVFGDGV